MKQRNVTRKLVLSKNTVANLSTMHMNGIKGGVETNDFSCRPEFPCVTDPVWCTKLEGTCGCHTIDWDCTDTNCP